MIAASGFSAAKNFVTAAWFVRSSSLRVCNTSVTPGSRENRRTSAPPTIPPWPAMKSFTAETSRERTARWRRQLRDLRLAFRQLEIVIDHDPHQLLETHLRLPAQLPPR